jgi:hypothetical protein
MARGLLLMILAVGCHRGAKTPEEAFLMVERALAAGDGVTLYKCLDSATRASIDSTYKDQQLQRTIIVAKYPEEEQARALQPLAAAAEPDAAHYFAHSCADRHLFDQYRPRLGSISGPIKVKPDGDNASWVARQDGMPFHFAKDSGSGWAFTELATQWALEKDRANHAVKTVRDNAALYNKAQ